MANPLRLALPLLFAAGSILSGCDEKKAAPPPPPPAEVGVMTVKPQSVNLTTELPGRTSAFLTADVRPQVNGLIYKRIFTEGADVKEGQQLYQIDPSTYQATYDSAVATLAHNQAALATARAKAARFKPLAAAQAVSRQDADDATAAAAEAVADIATAKAAIEQARINLAYTKVQAPISGRIGRSTVTPGALVTANQTQVLATVTQLDPIYVDVTQPSTTLLRLRQEMAAGKLQTSGPNQAQVNLVLDDGTKYATPGTLQFSEVNVDQTTGTVLLRAIFPNPDRLLLPGLYVRAELQEGKDDNAFLVPQVGVSHNSHGDPTVLLVGKDNKVSLKIVQTGRAFGDKWMVTSGLSAGDRVVVDGLQKARPGATVKPTEVDPDKPAAPDKPGVPDKPGAPAEPVK
ncbi:efflux RND transporter periplasmic adaptor subunit [Acidisphaera sp. L21]|uniref:efflux RND transporter periplasmic adaptor subunit n=1 Tax=Acidisphaera sp. L21 TaxID=1641851 RepID=UPI00131E76CE|nr:efflux RND transporter periplasmic adaptor subunit [Acidisphaera sp. L21]